jgi:threonine dehydrogenase-like Zn-dependent dehydrogenase
MQDIAYEPELKGSADIVIEATGSTTAALFALEHLPPLGVLVVLGAPNGAGAVPFLRMIVNNQSVLGSVNADGEAFRAAVEDLARFDRRALAALITRTRFADLDRTLTAPPFAAPKIVHVLP